MVAVQKKIPIHIIFICKPSADRERLHCGYLANAREACISIYNKWIKYRIVIGKKCTLYTSDNKIDLIRRAIRNLDWIRSEKALYPLKKIMRKWLFAEHIKINGHA